MSSGLGGSIVSSQPEDGGRKRVPATLTRRDALKRISLNAAKAVSLLVLPRIAGAEGPEIIRYASAATPGAAAPGAYPDYASYASSGNAAYASTYASAGTSGSSGASGYGSYASYRDSSMYSSSSSRPYSSSYYSYFSQYSSYYTSFYNSRYASSYFSYGSFGYSSMYRMR